MRHRPRSSDEKKRGVPKWFVVTLLIILVEGLILYPAVSHFTSFKPDTIWGE